MFYRHATITLHFCFIHLHLNLSSETLQEMRRQTMVRLLPISQLCTFIPLSSNQLKELEFETKSGQIRYLLVNATTRRDAENKVIGVVGVAQDVTESTKNDRAMSAMARELRQLVDTANAPIFGIDVNGKVNEWNDKTAEITGYNRDEAMGFHLVKTFIVPKLRQSVQDILDNALQGVETSNYELEFRTKSDEVSCLHVRSNYGFTLEY